MKNLVITHNGEYVEIIGGSLNCFNVKHNWGTISDWLTTEKIIGATVTVYKGDLGLLYLKVDFPESVPTHKMESLLEHFEYQ